MRQFRSHAYSVMRFFVGALFTCHGAQKLFGVLGGRVLTSQPKFLAAGIIEFGAGLLIALGLFASFAAFVACGEMAVAYFTQHAPGGFWPIVNRGELAVLYCFVFLFIIFEGDGAWSLGALFKGKFGKGI
jgi:putative oxidoreductase